MSESQVTRNLPSQALLNELIGAHKRNRRRGIIHPYLKEWPFLMLRDLLNIKPPKKQKQLTRIDISNRLVLSLDYAQDRRAFMKEQLLAYQLPFTFYSAISPTNSQVRSLPKLFRKRLKGELGCSLSHWSIWKMINESDWKHTHVLEDDTKFIERHDDLYSRILAEVPEDYDIIYLAGCSQRRVRCQVTDLLYAPFEMACTDNYLISKKGAQNLLAKIKSTHKPIDLAISQLIREKAINAYCSYPFLSKQIPKDLLSYIRREV